MLRKIKHAKFNTYIKIFLTLFGLIYIKDHFDLISQERKTRQTLASDANFDEEQCPVCPICDEYKETEVSSNRRTSHEIDISMINQFGQVILSNNGRQSVPRLWAKNQNMDIESSESSEILKSLDLKGKIPNKNFYMLTTMPRSGSKSIKKIMNDLSIINKFEAFSFPRAKNGRVNDPERSSVQKTAQKMIEFYRVRSEQKYRIEDTAPILFIQDTPYFDLTVGQKKSKKGVLRTPQPTMIGMVRHPIDRWVSQYLECQRIIRYRKNDLDECEPILSLATDIKDLDINKFIEILRDTNDKRGSLILRSGFLNWIIEVDGPVKNLHYEQAKEIILRDYFVMGCLENLSETLKLQGVLDIAR